MQHNPFTVPLSQGATVEPLPAARKQQQEPLGRAGRAKRNVEQEQGPREGAMEKRQWMVRSLVHVCS